MPHEKRYQLQPTPGFQFAEHGAGRFGLGRHVNHDPASRRWPFRLAPARAAAALEPVYHQRHIPVFDQGELGSCTGNAALGILATGPYWDPMPQTWHDYGPLSGTTRIPWTEEGAVMVYTAASRVDDFDGEYPPDDTGSDGLSAAKVLVNASIVPGYEHTFSLRDALAALQHFPLLVGTVWTEAMFEPQDGLIRPTGATLGGHEWIVDEYVPAGYRSTDGGASSFNLIGGTTSWGEDFGIRGRFYMRTDDFGRLLDADGDVIVLTPPNATPPEPTPDPAANADTELAAAMRAWLEAKGL